MSIRFLLIPMLTLFIPHGLIYYAQPDVKVIRQQLIKSIDQQEITDSLYNSLSAIKQPSPLIIGYIGTLQALKAKHTWNPYFKIKYLNDAEHTLQEAVTADPHNIEIRFMRFSIEHNVPGLLGYTKNLSTDKTEMMHQIELKYYGSADKPLVVTIIKFLIESKRCNTSEKDMLNKQLATLN